MSKRTPFKLTICRLLTLLLIVLVGIGRAANQVNGASLRHKPTFDFGKVITDNPSSVDTFGSTIIREHSLENVCSQKLIKVFPKNSRTKVNARGTTNSIIFSRLIFQSLAFNRLTIMATNQVYICFNKKGRLITRDKIPRSKKKAAFCEFTEEYTSDNRHTTYRSAASTTRRPLYIGFNHKGKPLKGRKNNRKEDCYKFIKTNLRAKSDPECPPKEGQGPNFNFCDKEFLWRVFNNKLRHQSHKEQHRRNG